jgi:hypothetical protein
MDRRASLRELVHPANLQGLMPETTAQGALRATTPLQPARDAREEQCGVRLPGDPCGRPYEPLVNRPQEALRMLENPNPAVRERAARAIRVYEVATGEQVARAGSAPAEAAPAELPTMRKKLLTRRSQG